MTRLEAMLGEVQTDKFFFPAVRFKREMLLREEKLTYSWEAKGFKVYPSQLKSWTMCPHRYIFEDVHKPSNFSLPNKYKAEVGTYLHKMYQDCAVDIKNLLWETPNFQNILSPVGEDKVKELAAKYKEIYPEVPVFDLDSGVSGRADAVLNMYGKPVVFDLKTTSVADMKWDPKAEDWEINRWEQQIKKFPSEQHKIQVSIYCYLFNKYQYYKLPIRKAGLGYINLLKEQGESSTEFECYFDFTEEMEKKTATFLHHIGKARRAYLAGQVDHCEYPLCRAHNLRRTLAESE